VFHADTLIKHLRQHAMHITPISLSQTLRTTAPVIAQIGRVEKKMAPDAVAGRGRVASSDQTGKTSRTGVKRRKMGWNGLGESVDVFA